MTTPNRPAAILVIDDDETVAQTFARALSLEGYDVRVAANAQIGLEEVREWRADAIILDLRMPFVNGLGFLFRLRSQDKYRRTPVAIVTGDCNIDDDEFSDMRTLGAHLRFKPLWVEDLVELTRTLLVEARQSTTDEQAG